MRSQHRIHLAEFYTQRRQPHFPLPTPRTFPNLDFQVSLKPNSSNQRDTFISSYFSILTTLCDFCDDPYVFPTQSIETCTLLIYLGSVHGTHLRYSTKDIFVALCHVSSGGISLTECYANQFVDGEDIHERTRSRLQ